jgi:hypothetical protein
VHHMRPLWAWSAGQLLLAAAQITQKSASISC